jgi:Uncharacterized protein conserved in bacteria (DUF2330)
MGRPAVLAMVSGALAILTAAPALACGGLIAPNGAVNLLRTSTLAAYHDGIEHYVTSFEFAGAGTRFGSIIPLPGVPSKVIKGGDWTLQRLAIETQPPQPLADGVAFAGAERSAQVVLEKKIAALDVTVVKGGGDAIGKWATSEGFNLPPDAPEVLDFYATRSPVFMAVSFDPKRADAQGIGRGDGIPVHVAIPTDNPWVPLRILGLGKQAEERIGADVYLLTDGAPALLPNPASVDGLELKQSGPASKALLRDLRSDRGMSWLPPSDMWLTYMQVDSDAGSLTYDLAVDASGRGRPSQVDAGLVMSNPYVPHEGAAPVIPAVLAWLLAAAAVVVVVRLTTGAVGARAA